MKKGQSRYPPLQFRLKEEDLIRETDAQQVKSEGAGDTWTFLDDYS